MTTELQKHNHIKSTVAKYSYYLNRFNAMLSAVELYNAEMLELTSEKSRNGLYTIDTNRDIDKKRIIVDLKRDYIRELLNVSVLGSQLSERTIYKLETDIEKISEISTFEISEQSAHELISNLLGSADELIKKSLKDVYLTITAHAKKFKSMNSYKIDKKIIITYAADEKLRDLERCLNLVNGSVHELDQFNDFRPLWRNEYEIKERQARYFKVKSFKKSVHITFTDLDALDALNRNVGKYFNFLKG